MSVTERIDNFQQQRRRLAIAAGTFRKFGEDESTNLASLIAFWAFFSIFPLLLVAITLLGYLLPADRRSDVLDNVASFFPLINPGSVGGLTGAWWALVLGAVTALWGGMAFVRAAQVAFDSVWEIPRKDRPGIGKTVARSLLALSTIGVGLLAATFVSSFVTGDQTAVDLGWAGRLAGYLVALALDVGLFVLAFRILTERSLTFRDVLPGALLAGAAFWILQQASSVIISHYLKNAQGTYGHFAVVITLLWWFYLQAQITLLGAQLNVVLKDHLYPRSLFGTPRTDADRRALEAYVRERTYHERQQVGTRIREPRTREPRVRRP